MAVPTLPTTMPAAWLLRMAASSGEAPPIIASVKDAITVSPAPETSKTSLRPGRDVKRLVVGAAEQHPQFAQGDEQEHRTKFLQEPVHGLHQVAVGEGIRVPGVVRHIGEFEGFLAIGRNERETLQVQMVDGFGIEAQPDAVPAAKCFDLIQQRLGDGAFAVIAHDHRRRARQPGFQGGEQAVSCRIHPRARLAVEPHDLLLMRDDAGLDAGAAPGSAIRPSQPI